MPIEITMPKLSDNMEEGTIIRWFKKPGERVNKGEPLAEVETDKADVELEAAASGVLAEITVGEGRAAAVGAVIARLGEEGQGAPSGSAAQAPPEAASAKASSESAKANTENEEQPAAEAQPAEAPKPERRADKAKTAAEARPAEAEKAPAPSAKKKSFHASPLAAKLAEENHVNLETLRGSGPGGRILKRDVEMAIGGQAAPPTATTEAPAGTPAPAVAEPRTEELSRMRQTIARRMSEAKREIPHFYVTAEIDMSDAMRMRESIRELGVIPNLTVTHLLVKALAMALTLHPRVNASWQDNRIELHDYVHIGFAVAVEDGLLVPVLHGVERLSLADVADAMASLTENTRAGKFSGDQLSGATFSLSNMGMLDIEELIAVINPPQAALLATGSVKDRPVVRNGQLAVAKTMRATLSCDHRVLNGVEGGRFLEELKRLLENPFLLFLEEV